MNLVHQNSFPKLSDFPWYFTQLCNFSGGGHFQKACRSRKKESKQSEITCKQSEPVRTISKIEKRREFVRALCYQQCPDNSFKRLYIVKRLLVLVEKTSVSKEFRWEFQCGGEGQSAVHENGVCYTEVYSGEKPWYIQRFAGKIPRFRRAGLPFTSVETWQKIRELPWKPVSYGDSNENLKTCKLWGLQWKFQKVVIQIFWHVSTEVHGSPARQNLGIFLANRCMCQCFSLL